MGFDTIIANVAWSRRRRYHTPATPRLRGKIAAIGQNLLAKMRGGLFDAAGKYVLPGGIDVHTHLAYAVRRETSADDFETGTRAARSADHDRSLISRSVQRPDLRTAFDTWMQKASGKAVCDYSFIASSPNWPTHNWRR